MRICVQWALAAPSDFEAVEAADWYATPSKPDPTGVNPTIDGVKGWVNRLCVQGVEFTADHYHVQQNTDSTRITVWSDDPRYYNGGRNASVWDMEVIQPDPYKGGIWNTCQTLTRYAEGDVLTRLLRDAPYQTACGRPVTIRHWSEFTLPPASEVRHGVSLPEGLYLAHERARHKPGWREWTEGIPRGALHEVQIAWCRRCAKGLASCDCSEPPDVATRTATRVNPRTRLVGNIVVPR